MKYHMLITRKKKKRIFKNREKISNQSHFKFNHNLIELLLK